MQKACIIGYGAIGPVHARAIDKAPKGVVEAICDIRPQRADKGAEKYHCRPLYDFESVLTDPDIDVVHICTPHYLHVDMACRALAAGKHVVLEKPVAVTKPDLDRLIAAEKAADTMLCIMLQNRTTAGIRKLMEIVKTDESLGKLIGISGFMTWNRDEAYYAQDPWRGHWATEGGSLLCNQAIHLIDLMHVFAGRADTLRASISTKRLEGVIETEDTADALIEFASGVRGVFFAANTYTTSKPVVLELDFENTRFRYADQTLYKIQKDSPIAILESDAAPVQGKAVWGSGHQHVIGNFYRHLTDGSGDYPTLTSALPSAKTLLAMYESGKAGGVWTNVEK